MADTPTTTRTAAGALLKAYVRAKTQVRGGKVVPVAAYNDSRVRKPEGVTERQMARISKLLESGQAEITKVGRKFRLRVKPAGHVKYTTVGEYRTQAEAILEIQRRFGVASTGQRDRAYKDVGEKIGGARKDIQEAARRFKTKPDLKSLKALEKEDPAAAALAVRRSVIWPKPTLDAYRAAGRSDMWSLMALITYERVPEKNAGHTEEDRREFMLAVQEMQDLVEGSQGAADLYNRLKELRQGATMVSRYKQYEALVARGATVFQVPPAVTDYQQDRYRRLKLMPRLWDWVARTKPAHKIRLSHFGWALGIDSISTGRTIYGDEETYMEWTLKANALFGPREKKTPLAPSTKAPRWERTVPTEYERRGGKPVRIRRPEEYIKRFGLRGVEFGNWMDDEASRLHVDRCAEAFEDLAYLLGLKAADVSLNGRLALAFGARGSGGALAHYEPFKRVINLTKLGGNGSLGHEWGHFLDHAIGMVEGTKQQFPSDANSTDLRRSESPVLQALGAVVRRIYRRPDDMSSSDFYKDAKGRGAGHYWDAGHEMFARAFETYLLDRFRETGRANNYLVNVGRKEAEPTPEESRDLPYPKGEERIALNAAFDNLIAALHGTNFMAKAFSTISKAADATPKAETAPAEKKAAPHFTQTELKRMGLKWVTAHPNGAEPGTPILVRDLGDEYQVVGGAGGSMNFTRFRKRGEGEEAPKRKSKKVKEPVSAEHAEALAAQRATATGQAGEKKRLLAEQIRAIIGADHEATPEQLAKVEKRALKMAAKLGVSEEGTAEYVKKAKAQFKQAQADTLDQAANEIARAALEHQAEEALGVAGEDGKTVDINPDEQAAEAGVEAFKVTISPEQALEVARTKLEMAELRSVAAAASRALHAGDPEAVRALEMSYAPLSDEEVTKQALGEHLARVEVEYNAALVEATADPTRRMSKDLHAGAADAAAAMASAVAGTTILSNETAQELGVAGASRVIAAYMAEKLGGTEAAGKALRSYIAEHSSVTAAVAMKAVEQQRALAEQIQGFGHGEESLCATAQAGAKALEYLNKARQIASRAMGGLETAAQTALILERGDKGTLIVPGRADEAGTRAKAAELGLSRGNSEYAIRRGADGWEIIIPPESFPKLYNEQSIEQYQVDAEVADIRRRQKGEGYPDWTPEGQSPNVILSPHQQAGIKFWERQKHVLITDQAGAGKTATILCGIADLHKQGKVKRAVIVVPKSVALQFGTEIAKFLGPEYADQFVVASGKSKAARLKAYNGDQLFTIITHDTLRSDDTDIQEAAPDALAVDEAHYFSIRGNKEGSQRSQAARSLNAEYTALFTGTPIKNSIDELHSLVDWMQPGLLGTKKDFIERYGALASGTGMFDEALLHQLSQRLAGAMMGVRLSVEKGEGDERHFELTPDSPGTPPVEMREATQMVDLTGEQRKQYKAEEAAYLEYRDEKAAGFKRDAALERIANNVETVNHPKVIQMRRDLAKHPGEKAVIFATNSYSWNTIVEGLQLKQGEYELLTGSDSDAERKRKQDALNDPKSPVRILVASDAANFGINLQGASVLMNFDASDTAATHEQRIGREFRRGQKRNVAVYNYRTKTPLEIKAQQRILDKGKTAGLPVAVQNAEDNGLAKILQAAQMGAGETPVAKAYHKPTTRRTAGGKVVPVAGYTDRVSAAAPVVTDFRRADGVQLDLEGNPVRQVQANRRSRQETFEDLGVHVAESAPTEAILFERPENAETAAPAKPARKPRTKPAARPEPVLVPGATARWGDEEHPLAQLPGQPPVAPPFPDAVEVGHGKHTGPVWEHEGKLWKRAVARARRIVAGGETIVHEYPEPDAAVVAEKLNEMALPGIPHFEILEAGGATYIGRPIVVPLEGEDLKDARMMLGNEGIATLEDTLRQVNAAGIELGDDLQLGYDPEARGPMSIVIHDWSNAHVITRDTPRDWWNGINELMLTFGMKEQVQRREQGNRVSMEVMKETVFGKDTSFYSREHRCVYGSYYRPLGVLYRGIIDKAPEVDPKPFIGKIERLDGEPRLAHSYLVTTGPLPPEVLVTYDLEALYVPPPHTEPFSKAVSRDDAQAVWVGALLPKGAAKKLGAEGEHARDLHMTVLFIPDGPRDAAGRRAVLQAVRAIGAQTCPARCQITGTGIVGKNEVVEAGLVTVANGAQLHADLVRSIADGWHDFKRTYDVLPHVTLRDLPAGAGTYEPTTPLEQYTWTAAELVVEFGHNGKRYVVPLAGTDKAHPVTLRKGLARLLKAYVKGHYRTESDGKRTWVRPYNDGRPPGQAEPVVAAEHPFPYPASIARGLALGKKAARMIDAGLRGPGGQRIADERTFIYAWAYGELDGLPPFDGLPWLNNDFAQAFSAACGGEDDLPLVRGWRYGHIPKDGAPSHNYREQEPEAGVSLWSAQPVGGGEEQVAADWISGVFIAASNKPKVWVEGYLIPKRGSDGEPLVIGAREIPKPQKTLRKGLARLLKGYVKAHIRTVDGKTVQVRGHTDKRTKADAPASPWPTLPKGHELVSRAGAGPAGTIILYGIRHEDRVYRTPDSFRMTGVWDNADAWEPVDERYLANLVNYRGRPGKWGQRAATVARTMARAAQLVTEGRQRVLEDDESEAAWAERTERIANAQTLGYGITPDMAPPGTWVEEVADGERYKLDHWDGDYPYVQATAQQLGQEGDWHSEIGFSAQSLKVVAGPGGTS